MSAYGANFAAQLCFRKKIVKSPAGVSFLKKSKYHNIKCKFKCVQVSKMFTIKITVTEIHVAPVGPTLNSDS